MKTTILIALAVLVALGSAARADDPSSAEVLYAEGQIAYDHADYAVAIAKWRASYDLSNESGLLFNLAQAYRLSGDCTRAISTYKQFVAIDPTADQRPLAEDFMRELEPRCATPITPIPAAVPIPTPIIDRPIVRPVHAKHSLKLAGLVTSGTGVVLIATGLGLGHHAQALGDEVTAACAISCDWSTEKGKDAAGRRDAAIGHALDALGAAAIVGGAILYYFGDRESAVTVAPLSARSGAVVWWSGSW